MKTYKHYLTNKIVTVVDMAGVGMCRRTIGRTMVLYKEKGDSFHRVMDSEEFYNEYKKIN